MQVRHGMTPARYVGISVIILAMFAQYGRAAEIENVTFQQRPGTKLVDIAYDLIGSATERPIIEAFYSLDAGADGYPYRIESAAGDIGGLVVPGLGKRIVWEAERDAPGVVASNARVKVCLRSFVTIGGITTGVTRSDAPYDDGYYRKGRPFSYTDHGDGTVTDNNTGLMWVKEPVLAGVGDTYDWTNAISVCEDLVYAGHSDWRLPTIEELSTLRDAGRYEPAIDPLFACQSSYYWSSSTYTGIQSYAWGAGFDFGYVNWKREREIGYVRPVRASPSPSARFTDNGDGTVTDNYLGLTWVQDPTAAGIGDRYNWATALAVCENLVYAGYADWRMPNVNELQSLVDYSRFEPAINPIFACQSAEYWSSSAFIYYTTFDWYLTFDEGLVTWNNRTIPDYSNYYVRPVRGGL